ncbi:MAG: hypothetical protein ACYTGN_15830 [Planctomycetota bacterium]
MPSEFVAGLQRYIDEDGPIYPPEDSRVRALHEFLWTGKQDPRGFLELLGPRRAAEDVEEFMLRRDIVGLAIVTALYRRLDAKDPEKSVLYDAVAYASVNFGFDPLYGSSHTRTGAEVADLFIDPELPACAESKAALNKHLEPLIAAWRKRVTEKATTTMMAIFVRHLGASGADRLFLEWEHMSDSERYNLLKTTVDAPRPFAPATRKRMVDALLATSFDVRGAAFDALEKRGAPLKGIDIVVPEKELREALGPLRAWAAETGS